jgi:hypothetical protein
MTIHLLPYLLYHFISHKTEHFLQCLINSSLLAGSAVRVLFSPIKSYYSVLSATVVVAVAKGIKKRVRKKKKGEGAREKSSLSLAIKCVFLKLSPCTNQRHRHLSDVKLPICLSPPMIIKSLLARKIITRNLCG